MKTSLTTALVAVCFMSASVIAAEPFQFGFGGQMSMRGVSMQVNGMQGRSGHSHMQNHSGRGMQGRFSQGVRSTSLGSRGMQIRSGHSTSIRCDIPGRGRPMTPGVWSEWSEWRPVGQSQPQLQLPARPRRPRTPSINSPGTRPATSQTLVGTWKASDRVLRIEPGNRFTIAWVNNGAPEQASGSYTKQGEMIIFKSDAGDVWPWNVDGFGNGKLIMSHFEVGQRVFERVNG